MVHPGVPSVVIRCIAPVLHLWRPLMWYDEKKANAKYVLTSARKLGCAFLT